MALLIRQEKNRAIPPGRHVAYFYRPETITPAKVFVYLEWEAWTAPGLRAIGVVDELPFYKRVMTQREYEFCARKACLTLHSFDDWDKLIARELKMSAPYECIGSMHHYQQKFILKKDIYV